ncbi:HEAT repeat domain-containing protein [Myxococcota bacterium]|nr:HEAT repeat domain-containing protein [Myxococcota bacterium]
MRVLVWARWCVVCGLGGLSGGAGLNGQGIGEVWAQSSRPSSVAASRPDRLATKTGRAIPTHPATQPSKRLVVEVPTWEGALQLLRQSSVTAQDKAVQQLVSLGEKAKEALPSLFALLGSSDVLLLRAAKRAIVALGIRAVPALLQRLNALDRDQRFHAQSMLVQLGAIAVPSMVARLPQAAPDEQERLLDTYAAMGSKAAAAGEQILDLFLQTAEATDDRSVRLAPKAEAALLGLRQEGAKLLGGRLRRLPYGLRERALRLLEQMGPMASPARSVLVEMLGELPIRDREPVVRILGQMQEAAAEALPAILEQRKTPLASLQLATVVALGQIHTRPEMTLPALEEALKATDLAVRVAAAYAIGRFPAAVAKRSLPALREALKRADPVFQASVCQTLVLLGADALPALPELIGLLSLSQHTDTQLQAIRAIGSMRHHAKDAITPLIRMFSHRNASIRHAATQAIADIGVIALPVLERELRSRRNLFQFLLLRRSERRNAAAHAIGLIGPPAKASIPALLWALTKPLTRRNAVWALGQIGADAQSTLPALLRYKGDKSLAVRLAVLEALGKIRHPSEQVKAALLNALSHHEASIRQQAIRSVALLSPAPLELLPRIVPHLASRTDRRAAREALRAFGISALPVLQQALKSPSWEMRVEALRTLASLAPSSIALLPSILQSLHDDDYRVRAAAARALVHFPQQASVLLPILQKHRNDSVPYVQMEVLRSLQQLSRTP